jgi:hypothetical protein
MNKKNIIFSTAIVFLMMASTSMISYTVKADIPNLDFWGNPNHVWCWSEPIYYEETESFGALIVNNENYAVNVSVAWYYDGELCPPNQTKTIPANSATIYTNISFPWVGEIGEDQTVIVELWWNNTFICNATYVGHAVESVDFSFNSYDTGGAPQQWTYNPSYMANGMIVYYASTTVNGDVELLDGNTCTGYETGDIESVWIRTYGYYSGLNKHTILLRPVFFGTTDGGHYEFDTISTSPAWSPWFEITDDRSAPETWTWYEVDNLDCDVITAGPMSAFTMYCSQVEIRVCYT